MVYFKHPDVLFKHLYYYIFSLQPIFANTNYQLQRLIPVISNVSSYFMAN